MFYNWLLALHIISVISWMAGMLYLPRLYVYHAGVAADSPEAKMLIIMERRLLRFIVNPAMGATFLFGLLLIMQNTEILHQPYMHIKLTLVLLMTGVHGYLARLRKILAAGRNTNSVRFYRVLNEIPTLLMIAIVILIVVKPHF